MKKLLKSFLVLSLIVSTIFLLPGDASARRYVRIQKRAGTATYTFKNSLSAVFGAIGGTTSSMDTSGSNLLVACIWDLAAAGNNISDSKSNTWTALTAQTNANLSSVCYYVLNPTVGTGHTFTTTSHFVGVGVLAMSTSGGTPVFDQQSGSAQNSPGTIQPGSLTPTVNNSLVVTAMGSFNGTTGPSMPTGYTQVASNTTSTAEAGGMGYKIQTTASAENPTWTSDGSSETANLAVFKP